MTKIAKSELQKVIGDNRDLGLSMKVLPEFLLKLNESEIDTICNIFSESFKNYISSHKVLPICDAEIEFEKNFDPYLGGDFFQFYAFLEYRKYGRGRPSGFFREQRQSAMVKYLPSIKDLGDEIGKVRDLCKGLVK